MTIWRGIQWSGRIPTTPTTARSTRRTLATVHLAALPAILSVLRPWNGRLGYHPHCYMPTPGGSITLTAEHWDTHGRGSLTPLLPVGSLRRSAIP